jgi:hypothetical protein
MAVTRSHFTSSLASYARRGNCIPVLGERHQGDDASVQEMDLFDKHAALVSIGKHLGMFTDVVQMRAVYGISEEPMSADGASYTSRYL